MIHVSSITLTLLNCGVYEGVRRTIIEIWQLYRGNTSMALATPIFSNSLKISTSDGSNETVTTHWWLTSSEIQFIQSKVTPLIIPSFQPQRISRPGTLLNRCIRNIPTPRIHVVHFALLYNPTAMTYMKWNE